VLEDLTAEIPPRIRQRGIGCPCARRRGRHAFKFEHGLLTARFAPAGAAIFAAPATAARAPPPPPMAAAYAAFTAAASAAATTRALRLGTCFIHHEFRPPKFWTVQGVHGLIRLVIGHFKTRRTQRDCPVKRFAKSD